MREVPFRYGIDSDNYWIMATAWRLEGQWTNPLPPGMKSPPASAALRLASRAEEP